MATDQGQLIFHFVFLPFLNHPTNKSPHQVSADSLAAHSTIHRSTIWFLTFDSSLVLLMAVERLEWKIQILWTGVH